MKVLVTLRHFFVVLLILLPVLILPGCRQTDGMDDSPELTVGDGLWDQGKHFFFPARYWRDKAAYFGQMVVDERDRYRIATQAYHEALKNRHLEIEKAVNQAIQDGREVAQARHAVIQKSRTQLSPLRQQSRTHGRAMRQAMDLMQKSLKNLERILVQ